MGDFIGFSLTSIPRLACLYRLISKLSNSKRYLNLIVVAYLGVFIIWWFYEVVSQLLPIMIMNNWRFGLWRNMVWRNLGSKNSPSELITCSKHWSNKRSGPSIIQDFVFPIHLFEFYVSWKVVRSYWEYKSRAIVLYDPRHGTFKDYTFPEMPNRFKLIVHIGSLNWLDSWHS